MTETPRRTPVELVSSCTKLAELVFSREQFFYALKGRARITAQSKTNKETIEMDLALMSPHYLRAEIVGPFGMRLGLLQINDDWIQFYEPRNKRVHRLPFKDFSQNSLRRDRFFEILPLPIPGPFFLDIALTQTGLPELETAKILRSCAYDPDMNVYRLLYVRPSEFDSRNRWHLVEIDPTSYFPLRHRTRLVSSESLLNDSASAWSFVEWDFRYSQFTGQGVSTLPRKLEVFQRDSLVWSFEWLEAEPVQDLGEEIFQWRPAASLAIQDY